MSRPNASSLVWSAILYLGLAAAAGASIFYLTRALDMTRWTIHTVQARDDAGVILEAALEEEVGARGYLITATPEYLAPYEDGAMRLMGAIDGFRRRTSDNDRQQKLAGYLEIHARALHAILARAVADARADLFKARADFPSAGTKTHLDAIRRLVMNARAEEDRLLSMRVEAADRDFSRIGAISIGAAVLMIGAIVPVVARSLRRGGEASQ